ncbi:MAG: hypothetical protein LUC24_01475 [Bacteroidales bacterium]|nr:hypothetical protein [Bacteroidales bacterium]
MKKILYILAGAALLAVLTSCEPKFKYDKAAYVILDETSVSVAENAGNLTIGVSAYPLDGKPNTEVEFEVIDGTGENGARNGVDFSVVTPQNGILTFDGDSTAYITFRISDANVGIYTGRKQFTVRLTGVTNGYTIGGAHTVTVTIADTDRNLEGEPVFGTYSASGDVLASSTSSVHGEWELKILEYPGNDEMVYMDGLAPTFTGGYDTYGDYRYAAYGWLEDDGMTLVIPSQVLDTKTSTAEGSMYIGYTPCVQFNNGWYYNGSFPDLKLHYDSATGIWSADYGVFVGGFTSKELSSMTVYFDAVAPGFTIVKVSD